MEAAGFGDIETWLRDEPTTLQPGDPLREYLRTVVLGAHLERQAPELREAFVDAVAANLEAGGGAPMVDYVRLNILATRW